jgi:hypothetical protein
MIKFFRKIRYSLMETGKTGKYLKYAIGEIAPMMLGKTIFCPVRDNILVATNKKFKQRAFRPACPAGRYAI